MRLPSGRSCAVLLALLPLLLFALPAHAGWWNNDFAYRVKIDADAGPKGANVGDPIGRTQVLIRLHSGNFKFDSAKEDGSDIRFVAADDKTPLHYHIEKWDGLVDQVALIWVDVPDLAPGTSTSFSMYWGNAKAADASDAHATYDADQVLVYHFADAAGLPHDSTGFNNTALTAGKRDEGGIIGFGLKTDAATPPIKLPASPSLAIEAGKPFTWQMWVKPKDPKASGVLFDQRDTTGPDALTVGLNAGVPFVTVISGAGTVTTPAPAPPSGDSWHLISVVFGTERGALYVDGVKAADLNTFLPAIAAGGVIAGSAAVTAAAPAPTPVPSGTPAPAVTALPNFDGQIDELEISHAARQAGAILIADKSQGPQANLLTLETPEQQSGFGSGYMGIILRSVTPDAWAVIGVLIVMAVISWGVMINKAVLVIRVAGADKKFRALCREGFKRDPHALLPDLAKDSAGPCRQSPLYRIYMTGHRELVDRLHGGRFQADGSIGPRSMAAIKSSMDATLVQESQRLNKMMVLLTIAIAGGPFIGLLGTVVGVMITFAAIAAAGDVNVNAIAPGISAALLATVAGLFVAIPALFGYNYFQVRIKGLMAEASVFIDEIVSRMGEGPANTLHHTPTQKAAE